MKAECSCHRTGRVACPMHLGPRPIVRCTCHQTGDKRCLQHLAGREAGRGTEVGNIEWSALIGQRAMAAKLIPSLRWRRHGIGVIQAYIREGGGDEVRIHVWHPDLVRPGIADHGDIHDHRFDLHSVVLHGTLQHEEFHTEPDPDGPWRVHQITHARQNPTGEFRDNVHHVVPGPLSPTAVRVTAVSATYEFGPADWYAFRRGHFHRSRASELVVTVATKTDQVDAGARVLSRHGSAPVNAFDPADNGDIELAKTTLRILGDAVEKLSE